MVMPIVDRGEWAFPLWAVPDEWDEVLGTG